MSITRRQLLATLAAAPVVAKAAPVVIEFANGSSIAVGGAGETYQGYWPPHLATEIEVFERSIPWPIIVCSPLDPKQLALSSNRRRG